MSTLKFDVLHGSWVADGEEFPAGENEIEDASDALVRLAGSAHAAGAIVVTEGLDTSHVEGDEASLGKLAEAMGTWVPPQVQEDGTSKPGYWDGPWYEGHLAASGDRAVAATTVDVEG